MMRPEMSKPQALNYVRAFIDVHTVGDTTIIPGVPGTNIRIYKFVLTAGGAVVITLKEGMRENSGGLRVANNGNIVLMFDSEMPLELPEGQPLVVNLNAAIRMTGFVEYTQLK
jgi:hypothetical protein